MKSLCLATALLATVGANGASASGPRFEADVSGDRVIVESRDFSQRGSVELKSNGSDKTYVLDQSGNAPRTRLFGSGDGGGAAIENNGGDLTVFFGICPPGTYPDRIRSHGELKIAVARCR
ncbi:hypothetical protein [Roseibium album]|uniref:hypothetical protein n=1 Tax=Roseibium album TaxID=311410 RepID=UPI0032998140